MNKMIDLETLDAMQLRRMLTSIDERINHPEKHDHTNEIRAILNTGEPWCNHDSPTILRYGGICECGVRIAPPQQPPTISTTKITAPHELLNLPVGSILIGRDGLGWWRSSHRTTPWEGTNGGGYGQSDGDLVEIATRFFQNESPLILVWHGVAKNTRRK